MVHRIFYYLSKKISAGFAVAIFSTSGSWIASFYGFYLAYSTMILTNIEMSVLIKTQITATAGAVFLHLVHFGLLHPLGFSGFSRAIRIINRNYSRDLEAIDDSSFHRKKIMQLYKAIMYLPVNNLLTAIFYTVIVIIIIVLVFFFTLRNVERIPNIIFGGVFAALIIGYFTFNITEYFIGPYKEKIIKIMYERLDELSDKYLLSFKTKTVFTLFLIVSSMVILTILIRSSEKPILQVIIFIFLSLFTIGFLIFFSMNAIIRSFHGINESTKNLALGRQGFYYPTLSDHELVRFSLNYNLAAREINEIRTDLEKKVYERTVELREAYNNLNRMYKQIQSDLLLAQRIQNSIMPQGLDEITGIKLRVDYYPMSEVGGDIYDIFSLYPGYIRFFLADALGHGIQAALVTMIIKSEYEKVKGYENTSLLFETLNNSFIDLYNTLNVFFSCIVVDIDLNRREILYSSAGHPDQLLISGGDISSVSHTGKLIGITRNAEFLIEKRRIKKGDKILLFTDGLFEQFNEKDEDYGIDKILSLIHEKRNLAITDLQVSILSTIGGFLGNKHVNPRSDDITLIGIEIME